MPDFSVDELITWFPNPTVFDRILVHVHVVLKETDACLTWLTLLRILKVMDYHGHHTCTKCWPFMTHVVAGSLKNAILLLPRHSCTCMQCSPSRRKIPSTYCTFNCFRYVHQNQDTTENKTSRVPLMPRLDSFIATSGMISTGLSIWSVF